MPAIRTLACKPSFVDGCLIFHFKVFVSQASFVDDDPIKFESVISQHGNLALGSLSRLYDYEFTMLTQRRQLVDDFLGQKSCRSRAPVTRAAVNAEIKADAEAAVFREKPVAPEVAL